MSATKMTDRQIDGVSAQAWRDAYGHIERGDFHAAYGVAERLRNVGLKELADELSDSIFCVQHDC